MLPKVMWSPGFADWKFWGFRGFKFLWDDIHRRTRKAIAGLHVKMDNHSHLSVQYLTMQGLETRTCYLSNTLFLKSYGQFFSLL